MSIPQEQIGVIEMARALAKQAVEVGSMKSLKGIVKASIEAGIDVRLIFEDDEEFKKAANEPIV